MPYKKRGITAELSFPLKPSRSLQFPAVRRFDNPDRRKISRDKNVFRKVLTFRKLELGPGAFLAVFLSFFFAWIAGKEPRLLKLQSDFGVGLKQRF